MPKWFVVSVALLGLNTLAVIGTTLAKSFANEHPSTTNASPESGSVSNQNIELNPASLPAEEEHNVAPNADEGDLLARGTYEQAPVEQEQPSQHSTANIPIPEELKVPSLGDPTKDPFFQELRALVSEQNSSLLSQTSPLDGEASDITREQSQEYFARLKHRLEVVSHLTSAAQGLTAEAEQQSKSPVDASKAAETLRQIMQLREMIGKLITQEL